MASTGIGQAPDTRPPFPYCPDCRGQTRAPDTLYLITKRGSIIIIHFPYTAAEEQSPYSRLQPYKMAQSAESRVKV